MNVAELNAGTEDDRRAREGLRRRGEVSVSCGRDCEWGRKVSAGEGESEAETEYQAGSGGGRSRGPQAEKRRALKVPSCVLQASSAGDESGVWGGPVVERNGEWAVGGCCRLLRDRVLETTLVPNRNTSLVPFRKL